VNDYFSLNRVLSACILASALSAFLLAASSSHAAPVVFESPETRVALLELFTSEGCSSCPPAEKWFSALKDSPGLWTEFVPVAFHVDYWDYLGWRDRWGSSDFTARQRAYVNSWHGDSVYTPGFVLNGKEWTDWSSSKEPRSSKTKTGVLKVSSQDQTHWNVTFVPTVPVMGEYEVHAAVLAGSLTSDVKAGENRGRRLNHDFVGTDLASAPVKVNADKLEGQFSIAQGQSGRRGLAVWLSHKGNLEPVQAVGGWLP
jgi:hypothetical protein